MHPAIEQLTQHKLDKKHKDGFSKVHKVVFKATFTAWAIYECAKFIKFLWLMW